MLATTTSTATISQSKAIYLFEEKRKIVHEIDPRNDVVRFDFCEFLTRADDRRGRRRRIENRNSDNRISWKSLYFLVRLSIVSPSGEIRAVFHWIRSDFIANRFRIRQSDKIIARIRTMKNIDLQSTDALFTFRFRSWHNDNEVHSIN